MDLPVVPHPSASTNQIRASQRCGFGRFSVGLPRQVWSKMQNGYKSSGRHPGRDLEVKTEDCPAHVLIFKSVLARLLWISGGGTWSRH